MGQVQVQSANDWVFPQAVTSGYIRPTSVYPTFDAFANAYISLSQQYNGRITSFPSAGYLEFADVYDPNKICHLIIYDHEPNIGVYQTTLELVVYSVTVGTGFDINSTSFLGHLYIYEYQQTNVITSSSVFVERRTQNASITIANIGLYQTTNARKHYDFTNITAASYSPPALDPITYRLTNCTAPGAPTEALSGSSVTVTLTPNSGYSFINPSSDIYVTNNGVAVASSYANGVLHFTMP